ncbi:hemolysin family protein [Pseudoduganella umbonata]|uniref:HlyC/CorC family transporter n=1 Tax=Pseudoduganella umbonata TaxID=864828 RepID=A0A4P8HJ03_9BURK|nr:hemolysin family protein [Pseudoduganella umbonata]MBB3219602.1 putative hemolysin [Pseudoduganella umbonata]QCP09669.1 HlyC/CorC family transporter [Pseudoduganella umbonata]
MEPLILIGLIVLNGVFAMSEIALVTARRGKLMKLAADGDHAAAAALELGEDPTRFLSTIQIGITSIGILNGIVGEAVLAKPLALWLVSLGIGQETAEIMATGGVVIVITYVSIVIGELVPKRLGQIAPEVVARLVARPMQSLAVVTRPFVMLLTGSTHAILRVMGVRQTSQSSVNKEEIHAMLEEGSESGAIEQQQHDIVRNLFRLDDRKLGSLMIPRSDIVFLDMRLPVEENVARLLDSEHSRFPVCDGGLANVLGVVTAKQALAVMAKGQMPDFAAIAQPATYVPETLTGMGLLEQFRASGMQMVFVIDEYGDIEGIVTVQDMLEALTGEFTPRNVEEAWAVQHPDGSWLLAGTIPVHELKDRLGLRSVPEEEKGHYHTISGMIMLLLGRLPSAGDTVEWETWRFVVAGMDDKRIDKVHASFIGEIEQTPADT